MRRTEVTFARTRRHRAQNKVARTHRQRPPNSSVSDPREQVGPRKKTKASKTSLDPITLTEGDLHDIGETVRDVTAEALQQFEEQQQLVLGALQTELQELQVRTPQAGTVSTSLAIGTSAAEEMLRTRVTNTIVLPDGALTTENEADRPMVSSLKGVGLNMAVLPRETLHLLQDGVTAELRARESRALQVMSEQRINIEQLSLQRNEVVEQNKQIMQVVEEACQMVPELAIQAEEPVEVRVRKLATGVREARDRDGQGSAGAEPADRRIAVEGPAFNSTRS